MQAHPTLFSGMGAPPTPLFASQDPTSGVGENFNNFSNQQPTSNMADANGYNGERAPAWARLGTTRVTKPNREATYGFNQGELTPPLTPFSHVQERAENKGQGGQPTKNHMTAKGWRAATGVPKASQAPSTMGKEPIFGSNLRPLRPFVFGPAMGGPLVCPMTLPFLGESKAFPYPPPLRQDDQDRVPRGTPQFPNFAVQNSPKSIFRPSRRDFAQETTSREVGIFAALVEARTRLGGNGLPFLAPKTHVMDDKGDEGHLAKLPGAPHGEAPWREFWGQSVPFSTPLLFGSREKVETTSNSTLTEHLATPPENSAKKSIFHVSTGNEPEMENLDSNGHPKKGGGWSLRAICPHCPICPFCPLWISQTPNWTK